MQNVYNYSLIFHWFHSQRPEQGRSIRYPDKEEGIPLNTPGNRKFMDPPEGKHKMLLKANVWSSTWVSVKMLVCPLDDLVWSCHFVIFPMTMWALWKKSAEYEPRRSLWTVMYSCSAVEGIKIRNTESEEDSEPKQSKTALV